MSLEIISCSICLILENKSTKGFWQQSIDRLHYLNFFPSRPPSTKEFDLRNQRISTRVFITLLILATTTLIVYNALINITTTITVNSPTSKQYADLYSTYSQTLTCPCSKISISYDKFVAVHYRMHQVCTSMITDEMFVQKFFMVIPSDNMNLRDFRLLGLYTFQALRAFCQISNRSIFDSLTSFYTNQYVSAAVTSEKTFRSQADGAFNQFVSSTTSNFLSSLLAIRDTTQANALFSGRMTNYEMSTIPPNMGFPFELVVPYSKNYSDCNCAVSYTCVEQAAIFNGSSEITLFVVPGLYIGCLLTESLLRSTLECLYNQTCIDQLQSYLMTASIIRVTALNSSASSRFSTTSMVQELVNAMMMEEWSFSSAYANYYDECRPSFCTYTYVTRNNGVAIVTILLGLIGGLVTVLKLIVPVVIKVVARFVAKQRGRTAPHIPHVEN